MRKSYVLLAVLAVFLVVVASAGTAGAKKPVRASGVVTFNVNLEDGQEVVLGESGALSLRAACQVDDNNFDRVQLLFVSTMDGWFFGGNQGPNLAGVVPVFAQTATPTGIENLDNHHFVYMAWAPDGSVMSVNSPVQMRFNKNGHPCGIAGTASFPNPAP
jgi:hypothetical protein